MAVIGYRTTDPNFLGNIIIYINLPPLFLETLRSPNGMFIE